MQRFDCLSKECSLFGPHLLEASAGTGKTFSIEHIYARLVLESIEAETILAVTFTRAAARELKARIRSNLEKTLHFLQKGEAPWPYLASYLGSETAMRKISDALAVFDRCQVFTTHSFCYRMLREYAFEARIGFSLPDPDKDRGAPQRLKEAADDFIRWGISEELISLEQCSWLCQEIGSLQKLKEKLLKREKSEGVPFSQLFGRYKEAVKGWKEPVEEAFLADDFSQLRINYKKTNEEFDPQVRALARSLSDPENPVHFRALLGTQLFKFLLPSNLKKKTAPVSLRYPGFFDWASAALGPLLAKDKKKVIQTIQAAWNQVGERISAEEDYFDPDELLLQMRKAIQIESFAQRIRNKYKAVVIDEFQDTDAVQWDIFRDLFVAYGDLKALYFVGDPKQSIYRFRKADVYTYLEARQLLGEERTYYLDTNFRSSKALIGALNAFFAGDWMALPKAKQVLPYLPIQAGSSADSEFGDGKGALHFFAAEDPLPYVLQEIRSLEAKVENLSRFAVLINNRYQAEEAVQYLKAHGVPAAARSQTPLGQTLAFQSIRELFDAIYTPHDFGKGKVVAAGPFGSLEDELGFAEFKQLLEEKGVVGFARQFLDTKLEGQTVRERIAAFDLGFYRDVLQIFEWLFLWEKREGFSFEALTRALDHLEELDPEEGGRRRVESEPDAVQIMTLHVSKGLEFDVVFGLGLGRKTPDGDEEIEAEKLRLLYVAMTRAKRRLYVPLGEEGSPIELFGRTVKGEGELSIRLASLLQKESVTFEKVLDVMPAPKRKREKGLAPFAPSSTGFSSSFLSSFTALAQKKERERILVETGSEISLQTLPRGADTGVAVHTIFERVFRERKAIQMIVSEETAYTALALWEDPIRKMVEQTLSYPLQGQGEFFTLAELQPKDVRAEMEFLFALPPHYVKGFIDLVFQRGGIYYLADWKTNWLEEYTEEAMDRAMRDHDYYLQAALYGEALRRHLGAEFESRFGGVYYFFVRGNRALFFQPDFNLIRNCNGKFRFD